VKPMAIKNDLIKKIKNEFVLDWNGIHGYSHWMRVKENGLFLAKTTKANIEIVELFAILHDSKRDNDGADVEHGRRAADFIKSLKGNLIFLDDKDFDLLLFACEKHSDGLLKAPVTVQTCWDADRLDLGRVGIRPDPRFLCTSIARDQKVIEWGYQRSLGITTRSL
jgi:uncharacterized protein